MPKTSDIQAPDDETRDLVARLSRPAPGGRRVIERAAILAEGGRSAAILDWLDAASWTPEEAAAPRANASGTGLHGLRGTTPSSPRDPRRYVSPPS